MKRKPFDINDHVGKKYGKLTIIGQAENRGRRIYLIVRCECKNVKETRVDGVLGGRVTSCGCLQKQRVSERMTKHSLSGHPLHKTWRNIKGRCYNKKMTGYKDWGGRGITVCDEWKNDFQAFYDWCINNGYEKGLAIDRKDNDKDYSPSNCHFVTQQVNNCNTRLIHKTNTSGYRGVVWGERNHSYRIYVNYKKERILDSYGFQTAKQAAIARDTFCIKNNIPLPLNFPELAINGPL